MTLYFLNYKFIPVKLEIKMKRGLHGSCEFLWRNIRKISEAVHETNEDGVGFIEIFLYIFSSLSCLKVPHIYNKSKQWRDLPSKI
jgi:hypothetical protein